MFTIRSCMSIVMLVVLSLLFQLSAADNLIVRNTLQNRTTKVMVACHAPMVDWWSFHHVLPGVDSPTINVPYRRTLFDWRSPFFGWGNAYYCNAFWKGVHVKVYRSYTDHLACMDNCIIELRDDGSFRWNEFKKTWDLIERVPHNREQERVKISSNCSHEKFSFIPCQHFRTTVFMFKMKQLVILLFPYRLVRFPRLIVELNY